MRFDPRLKSSLAPHASPCSICHLSLFLSALAFALGLIAVMNAP